MAPPQNRHCSSCGAVHGMLLPVPNKQGWPPWGQPHPMPPVQPPAQPFFIQCTICILYIHTVTIYIHTCTYRCCVHIPYIYSSDEYNEYVHNINGCTWAYTLLQHMYMYYALCALSAIQHGKSKLLSSLSPAAWLSICLTTTSVWHNT